MCGSQPEFDRPVYDQTDIAAMRKALDGACDALSFAFLIPGSVDLETREVLARHILADAALGERNPARLSAAALRQLPPRQAEWGDSRQSSATALQLRHKRTYRDTGIQVAECA
jgi:hypothetical protein